MHTKTDSDLTSIPNSTPPRSPPRGRPGAVYYVESPCHPDIDKMSYGSSPMGSPARQHYHCSPIHHSRESSTSRFSSSLIKHSRGSGWRRIHGRRLGFSGQVDEDVADVEEDEDEDDVEGGGVSVRFYVGCFLVCFVGLFGLFSLILWAASKSSAPHVLVKNMVFYDFNIQAGMDRTGVPTDMLSLNSKVNITYKNPATFFGVHVTSTPIELHYYNLKVATGQMKKFYQKRKSHSIVTTVVQGHQISLYGGMSFVPDATQRKTTIHTEKVSVALNLTFTVRSRAYILGKLVKSKFYKHIRCPVTLNGNRLGKSVNLVHSCVYK